MKLNETQARILKLCKRPKRPSELWKKSFNNFAYKYILKVMSNLEKIGLMTKKNVNYGCGRNFTWYWVTDEGLGLVKKKMKGIVL